LGVTFASAEAAHPNRLRLREFVDACLNEARRRPGPQARALLRRNAEHVERHLRTASAWAANKDGRPAPAHLEGLSAFDLADALDRLSAAANDA
jgi:hypothetical protein